MSETTATTTAADGLRARALKLDAADPLAGRRALFALDDGVYLDGNSLGALPVHVPARVQDVLARQWGELRIRSWDESGWWTAPERIGDRIAPLVGAAAGQIVVGDSTSVNVFKAVVAAARLAGEGRDEILVDADDLPHGRVHRRLRRPADRPPDRAGRARRRPGRARSADRRRAAQPRRLPLRPAPRPARTDRRRPRGRRGRGVGPVPQRRARSPSGWTSTGWTWRSAAPTST
ncbi:Kynureninase [Streptomyces californicus]